MSEQHSADWSARIEYYGSHKGWLVFFDKVLHSSWPTHEEARWMIRALKVDKAAKEEGLLPPLLSEGHFERICARLELDPTAECLVERVKSIGWRFKPSGRWHLLSEGWLEEEPEFRPKVSFDLGDEDPV